MRKVTIIFLIISIYACRNTESDKLGKEGQIRQPWPMHHINDDYLIANSMNVADIDMVQFKNASVKNRTR